LYSWYKRRSGDSVFLSSNKTYNIPMMQQQDIGTYVCKVELNNSCLTRLAMFELTGDCGHVYLPVSIDLAGKAAPEGSYLHWRLGGTDAVQQYRIERRLPKEAHFNTIGYISGNSTTGRYEFTDSSLHYGTAVYRVKAVMQNGPSSYSNTISLQREGYSTSVYPNPVRNSFVVSISGAKDCNYRVALQTVAGQMVYTRTLQNVTHTQQRFERPKGLRRGLYVLKVINLATGASTYHKLLFD
jgi:hypothetical protein